MRTSTRHKKVQALCFSLATALCAFTAYGSTFTWTGNGNGTGWADGANWQGGVVPNNNDYSDAALFGSAGTAKAVTVQNASCTPSRSSRWGAVVPTSRITSFGKL